MKKLFFILFVFTSFALGAEAQEMNAQEVNDLAAETAADTEVAGDSIAADTMVADTIVADPDPEWYVAPISYDSVVARFKAPRRTAAANCPIDSIRIFNVDSVLTAVTVYEYGDTTRTIEWTVKPDGTRIGQSKQEDANTTLTTYTATYDWDNKTNDWKGTNREDNVFNEAHKNISRTIYTWINNAWIPQTRYTYDYDEAGRQKEILTYTRNTSTNELILSKGIYYTWYNSSKKTLEINYTAHNGSDWSAGTKKEYAYDANGNQIKYIYYSSLSNGNWVGSTHETWIYNTSNKKTNYEKQTWSNGNWVNSSKELWEFDAAGKLTLHEKYAGPNSEWIITLREIKGYDTAGNNNFIENYSFTNGVKKGTNKEEYTFNDAKKKILTIRYKWSNNDWALSYKIVDNFDAAGNEIETANYNWTNNAWVGAGTRTLKTYNSSKKMTEQITQTWPTDSTNWVNSSRKTIEYSGAKTTQEATFTWFQNAWVGSTRSDWHYNASGLNDTTKTYTNNGVEWIYSDRTVNTYNASGTNIMTHKSHWDGSAWALVSMTRTDDIDKINEKGIREVLHAEWKCNSDSVWIGIKRDTTAYSSTSKKIYEAHYISWANKDWIPSYKIEYDYYSTDKIASQQRFEWKNDAWSGTYRYEYDYDAQGNQTVYATYLDWDKTNNLWIGSNKTVSVYNQNNKVISSISYSGEANTWVPVFRYLYTYDSSNREIEKTVEKSENSDWVYSEKYAKEYKGSTLTKDNSYLWLNSKWVFTARYEDYYDSDAQAKIRREIRGSWSGGSLISFSDKFYHYACDIASFTVKFTNYDGTVLASTSVNQGQKPEFKGTEPSKPATEQYSYSFKGWSPEIVVATKNATYVAEYDSVINQYTVAFHNYDGTELQSNSLLYGAMPEYNGQKPEKPATAQYTYSFTKWDKALATVTADAVYTAQFDSIENVYTITWLNDDDSQIDQTTVKYGVVPTHDDPTKAGTGEYSYTFTGWDKEVVAVTGDATYKATFSSDKNKYTITWLNDDNSQIDQTTVEYGVIPTHDDPTKQSTAEYTYAFTGWDKTVVAVTGDATYKATFSSTKNQYTITWLNDDDSQIDQTQVEYGIVPAHDDPTKQGTAEYTYTFTGWDKTVVAVTGDATYKATFSSDKNKYTITWLNDDNSQIDQTTVEYGVIPTHDDPTKAATAEFTYTFSGWDKEVVAVTGEATYKATFSVTKNKYLITWLYDDGTEIDHEMIEYGTTPQPANPTKESTAQYTFTFIGWDKTIAPVTGEATYTAVFDSVVNKYTIIFYYEDGVTEMERVTVEYGQIPATTVIPSIQGDEHYTYEFAGWSPEIQPVTGEATYTATFTATPRTYAITFKNYNGVLLQTIQVAYGEVPVYSGETPSKPTTAKYTYVFSGWTPKLTAVTSDATYTAFFEGVINTYTVIFYNEDGTELDRVEVEYGKMPTYTGETPTKAEDDTYTYTFAGWTPKLKTVTGDAAYTATYTAAPKGQGLDQINDQSSATKVMINGTIYILRAGKTYTIDGVLVQ